MILFPHFDSRLLEILQLCHLSFALHYRITLQIVELIATSFLWIISHLVIISVHLLSA